MVREEGGRWDVSIKDDAVYVERVSEDDKRLFDESLDSEEARDLAGLLTKFADKLDRSGESAGSDDDDENEEDEDDDEDDDDEEEDEEDEEDKSSD